MLMTRLSRCCCQAIRKRRPGGCGYVRDDRNAGSTLAPAVWFAYSPDRKGIHPQTHLAGFSGVLQADAYAGFNELYRDGRITEAACWAHARRKIHDVHVRTPSALTEEALKRIGELYAIEAEIRGMTAEQRLCRTSVENETAAEIPGKLAA
ncbi:Transposase and inactivated derivatives [Streptococcus pneumoniae]|nr:Transposase and inactivated derivatives [Streptococcus pneumoniae]